MSNSSSDTCADLASSTPSTTSRRPPPGIRRGRTAVVAAVLASLTAVALAAVVHTSDGEVASAVNTVLARGDTLADGVIGDRVVTAEDDEPAIVKLDPDLLAALRAATRDAAADDIGVQVTSGWRSGAFQQRLLDQAITTYGSLEEARRWVSTPEQSSHVTGDAVDVGPTDAAYWFSQHGADHGLCQVFSNEIWHYELLTEPGGSCPAPRPDAGG